jgi:hypothetical protein
MSVFGAILGILAGIATTLFQNNPDCPSGEEWVEWC